MQNNFKDWECPEFEEVGEILKVYGKSLETLRRVLGENRKAPVKIGDIVPAGISGWGKTRVVKIYKDLLGNEIWATEFTLKEHLEDELVLISPATARRILPSIFQNPDIVLYDKNSGGSVHYGKIKAIGEKTLFLFAIVGHQSLRFFTIVDRKTMYSKIKDRYWILWEKK
ncbi:hypothetical protein [Desulfurobacterium sp.]